MRVVRQSRPGSSDVITVHYRERASEDVLRFVVPGDARRSWAEALAEAARVPLETEP
jgi:hypothetical protein